MVVCFSSSRVTLQCSQASGPHCELLTPHTAGPPPQLLLNHPWARPRSSEFLGLLLQMGGLHLGPSARVLLLNPGQQPMVPGQQPQMAGSLSGMQPSVPGS
jgi:hypothetical protein